LSCKRLKNSLEEFVDAHLPKEPQESGNKDKIIHESIWGTHLYHSKEIAMLDTPLIQRLRRVHQTGLAFYTFPTAVHSRFDHTLGTINMCSKLVDELQEKEECKKYIDAKLKPTIRMAALLHDCGHGIFSHTSEEVYGLSQDIQDVLSEDDSFKSKPKPHEVLSCLIIKTERFKEFFEKVNPDLSISDLVKYITGNEENNSKFKAEILNSIYDGDKIDYVHRDAHFCGLPLRVDLDRLWYGINIMDIPIDGKVYKKLSISHNSTEPLEQILFHRTMLFPTLYQHQKVRACDCMFKGIVEYIKANDLKVHMGERNVTFQNPEDYLWGTDDDFLAIGLNIENVWLKNRLKDITTRNLFHRAITIASRTVDDNDSPEYARILALRENSTKAYGELRQLATRISAEASKKGIDVIPEDIWIDLPQNVKPSRDVTESFVFIEKDKSKNEYKFIPAGEIFPIHNWSNQNSIHKWEGHVFCPHGKENVIAPIAKGILEEEFNFKFKDEAFLECHVNPPK